MSTASSKSFGLRQDFPFVRMFGFFLSIFTMAVMRSTIDKIVPSPYYSITNKSTGEDYIIFTDDAIWMLILMLFVIFLTLTFIIPIVLYFRGLSKWEWDPTTVVFWLIITWSLSFFFTEIAETNSSIEAYVLVLSKISNTHQLGLVMYTDFILYFQLAGIVLLLAMIGAILLTFRKRIGVKKQSYINQISRNPSTAIELIDIKSNQGVKIDD